MDQITQCNVNEQGNEQVTETLYFVTEQGFPSNVVLNDHVKQVLLLSEDGSVVIDGETYFVEMAIEENKENSLSNNNAISIILDDGISSVVDNGKNTLNVGDQCQEDVTDQNNSSFSLHDKNINPGLATTSIVMADGCSITVDEENSVMESDDISFTEHDRSLDAEQAQISPAGCDQSSVFESVVKDQVASSLSHDEDTGFTPKELLKKDSITTDSNKGPFMVHVKLASEDNEFTTKSTQVTTKNNEDATQWNSVANQLKKTFTIKCSDRTVCPFCFKKCGQYKFRNQHIKKVHKVKPPKVNLKCKDCDSTYKNEEKLKIHYENYHNKVYEMTYDTGIIELPAATNDCKGSKCVQCNIKFFMLQSLRNHLSIFHKLDMTTEELRFPNITAFKKWKIETERKELVSYRKTSGTKKCSTGLTSFYSCNRSGQYKSEFGPERKKKKMGNAIGTAKTGVTCTAAIICTETPNEVIVKYCSHHYGHGKETPYLELSEEQQVAIQENVSKGIPFENLLEDIRDGQSSADHFRAFTIRKRDLRFIDTVFSAEEYHVGISDAQSLDNWVRLCSEMDDSPILYYKQEALGTKKEEFLLIMMTEFQRHILVTSPKQIVCLDTIRRLTCVNFYMTAILVVDECEVAFPVALCISNRMNKDVMVEFLTHVKESTGPLSYIYLMSDNDSFYYEAWQEVMGDNSKWVWSIWSVDCSIRQSVRSIKKEDIDKREWAYRTFRKILECNNQNVFTSMFKNFMDDILSNPVSQSFGNFVLRKFSSNAEKWACCYRKEISLSTNIYLEFLHKTLRYCCRNKWKRVDKNVFMLMKFVRYKMLCRLTGMLDDEKITLAKDAISRYHKMGLEIACENITSLSDKIWLVRSDDDSDVYVTKEFETCPDLCDLRCSDCSICAHTFSCTCMENTINANICQHIHAVVWKFLTPHFSPPPSPVPYDCDDVGEGGVSSVPDKCSELHERVLKRTHDVYKKVRDSECNLSKDPLSEVMKMLDRCYDICSGRQTFSVSDSSTQTLSVETAPSVPQRSEPTVSPSSRRAVTLLSQQAIPPLPKQGTPSLPQQETPSLPQQETPSLPQQETPSLPKQVTPSLPKQVTPSLPKQVTPSLPKQVTPSLPKLVTPSLPKQKGRRPLSKEKILLRNEKRRTRNRLKREALRLEQASRQVSEMEALPLSEHFPTPQSTSLKKAILRRNERKRARYHLKRDEIRAKRAAEYRLKREALLLKRAECRVSEMEAAPLSEPTATSHSDQAVHTDSEQTVHSDPSVHPFQNMIHLVSEETEYLTSGQSSNPSSEQIVQPLSGQLVYLPSMEIVYVPPGQAYVPPGQMALAEEQMILPPSEQALHPHTEEQMVLPSSKQMAGLPQNSVTVLSVPSTCTNSNDKPARQHFILVPKNSATNIIL